MAKDIKRTRSIQDESVVDERLIAEKTLLPPRGSEPTLNGGKELIGALFADIETGELSVYRGNGIWKKLQDELVSGSTIKTINGSSLLGSGNLIVEGGGGVSAPSFATFTYTSGVQSFTLDQAVNFGYYVSVNGILLNPTNGDYTFEENVLTIGNGNILTTGDEIIVCYVGVGDTPPTSNLWNDTLIWNDNLIWAD